MIPWQQTFDRSASLYLNTLARDQFWFRVATIFFARYAILFFLVAIMYLFWKKKVQAVFVTLMAVGLGFFTEYLISMFRSRPRPFLVHTDILKLDPVSGTISSFPSSHAVIVFAVATAILLYGHKKLGSVMLVLAVLVSIARIAAGVHYPSDVVVGAILGALMGYLSKLFVEMALGHSESPRGSL